MCIVRWYNTTAVCTWPVLVHYGIVVNPRRPIRAPVAEPYLLIMLHLEAGTGAASIPSTPSEACVLTQDHEGLNVMRVTTQEHTRV